MTPQQRLAYEGVMLVLRTAGGAPPFMFQINPDLTCAGEACGCTVKADNVSLGTQYVCSVCGTVNMMLLDDWEALGALIHGTTKERLPARFVELPFEDLEPTMRRAVSALRLVRKHGGTPTAAFQAMTSALFSEERFVANPGAREALDLVVSKGPKS